ncbi:MAG: hypothetical protein GY765_31030 [bacterium]|nr:hypothetical protein [bacterium]
MDGLKDKINDMCYGILNLNVAATEPTTSSDSTSSVDRESCIMRAINGEKPVSVAVVTTLATIK